MKVGLISDIHSNYFALVHALDILKSKIDVLVFAGDMVGYGPLPNKCIKAIKALNIPTHEVLGNHDLAVRFRFNKHINDTKRVKDDVKIATSFQFNFTAEKMVNINSQLLQSAGARYLNQLPYKDIFELEDDISFYLVHGTPGESCRQNIGNYLFPPPRGSYYRIISAIDRAANAKESDVVVVGHSHLRFMILRQKGEQEPLMGWSLYEQKHSKESNGFPKRFKFKEKDYIADNSDLQLIINPGSVGQPRDGSGNSSFALLDTDKFQLTFYDEDYPKEKLYQAAREKNVLDGPEFWARKY